MKISKKDALMWFEFFAQLPEGEQLSVRQQEIVYAVFAQIEDAVDAKNEKLMAEIPGLKSLNGRTRYVGDDEHFPRGCKSCLLGTGLTAIRKTNKCNIQCKFCYNYGELDCIPPIGEGMWEIGGTKFYERDIDTLLSIYPKPTSHGVTAAIILCTRCAMYSPIMDNGQDKDRQPFNPSTFIFR